MKRMQTAEVERTWYYPSPAVHLHPHVVVLICSLRASTSIKASIIIMSSTTIIMIIIIIISITITTTYYYYDSHYYYYY